MSQDSKKFFIFIAGIVVLVLSFTVYSYTTRAGDCIQNCRFRPDAEQYKNPLRAIWAGFVF